MSKRRNAEAQVFKVLKKIDGEVIIPSVVRTHGTLFDQIFERLVFPDEEADDL